MARQFPKPKRKRDATWFRDKVLLVKAQGSGKVLNNEELEFLAAYQVDDLDTYDYDCDDFSTAKAVLMANLSSYDSNVLSEKVKELDNIVCKISQSAQTMDMITKPQAFYDNNLKQAPGFQNPFYLKKAQQIRPMLYDGSVISKENNTSHPNSDQFASLPVKIEAPQELPKKQFLIENDRLLDQIISQEIVNIVVNSSLDINTAVNVNSSAAMNDFVNYAKMCNKCLELEAELIKQHNMVKKDEYNRLLKSFSKLEQHCISFELAMQLSKEIFQKNKTSMNQTEPSFDQLFELNNLKVKLQAKDTTIKKLKANIKRLNKTSTTNCVKKDIDEIETINIELEHRVAKLIAENEHLK
nr:hypothetical protein [Tanacetum cinerariifolium]